MAKILKVQAREVLDSRGFPTVEAEVEIGSSVGRAIVPSGASTGKYEALELRDGDVNRFLGKGVLKAVENINSILSKQVVGKSFEGIEDFDSTLIQTDGSENKSTLGANALLAVSLAWAKASAAAQNKIFAVWIQEQCQKLDFTTVPRLPVPMMNVINGGAHANNKLDIQEFMLVPHGFSSFAESLRAGCEIFHRLKTEINDRGLSTAVGDEGGFAPELDGNREALDFLLAAIEKSGFKVGDQISLALDCAATEFYKDGRYHFNDPSIGEVDGAGLLEYYADLCESYPIFSIEDAFAEDDWESWEKMTQRFGDKIQLVGDDLYVTQEARLKRGVESKASNAILIKLNQVGTLWETLKSMKMAKEAKMNSVVSHRSGETEDCSLAHLVVGTGSGQVKTGSASRSDRTAKYNELLRLEEKLGLKFPGSSILNR